MLGATLESQGRWPEALRAFRSGVEQSAGTPDAKAAGLNLLRFIHNYQVHLFDLQRTHAADPRTIADEHRAFGRQLEVMMRPHRRSFENAVDAERPLRIGYLSPDFRKHSVAHFIEPVIRHHDRTATRIYAYYTHPSHDDISAGFQEIADEWVECPTFSPLQLADRIRRDRIDILVDLAGHTVGNRAMTLAVKPAPVQISYLGYSSTTGLSTVDHRLTDGLADPPGLADPYFIERPLRVSPTMLVYRPPFGRGGLLGADPLPVEPTPALRNPAPTFGSFNAEAKLNDALIATWVQVLARVPGSTLIIKSSQGLSGRRESVLATFAAHGIGADRLGLLGRDDDSATHRRRYAQIDIALDTFPYNGVTTSCESLWMGVPFITLAGRTPSSRMGVSIATNVGHPEWVASSPANYVDRAVGLASDVPALNRLRLSLREALVDSPLMDAPAFVRNLEAAYRELWRQWCENRRNDVTDPSSSDLAIWAP